MGSLASNPAAAAAFDNQIFKKGLDLNRSVISRNLGTEYADPTAQIRAGSLVSRNSTGALIAATGTNVYGIAKWAQVSLGVSVQVDLPVVLNGTTPSNLTVNGVGRGTVSNVTVRTAPNMGGSLYVGGGTDYTVDAGNGTVVRVALGAIPDGATVYVTFTYALVDNDYKFDGRFWQNQPENRALYNEGRLAVITDWSRVFTVEWESGTGIATGLTYAVNTALYCSALSKFSSDDSGGSREFVGRCYQVPTATDPYMGVTAHGNPIVA